MKMEGDKKLQKLPVLVLENIMRFLPFKDIKNLRCLNSRFDKLVSLMMPGLIGTFKICDIGDSENCNIPKILSAAMRKPHFQNNKLDLTFTEKDDYHYAMVKILLSKFKDNISGLGICFKDGFYVFDYPSDLSDTEEINGESGLDKKVEEEDSLNFLLDPNLTFCALERLSVKFNDEMSSYDDYEEDEVEIPLIQVLINRHSKQIKELEIANLWGGCNLKLAHLESLTSLSLDKVDTYMALELLDDCRQKILKFKMTDIEFLDGNYDIGDMDLNALEITNLKHLHLHSKDIIISHLVSKNETRIESFFTNSNIVKFPLVPNLKILWINRASLEMLSKCHLTIQCLAVERDSLPFTNPDDDVYYDNENYDVLNDAPLPMLTDLYLKKMRSEKLLENSAATLEFLMIKCVRFMEYFEGRNVKLAKVHTVLMIDDGERYTDKHRDLIANMCPNANITHGDINSLAKRIFLDRCREKKWNNEFRDAVLKSFLHTVLHILIL